jgi:amidase
VASLCRLPQINIPAATVDGCPVGLSFIAGPRGDQRLLDLAQQIGTIQQHSQTISQAALAT